ncbi:MAG: helix-turn-helix transcriptional regulator [Bacteroidales bacterium]|nr:helix-turn-helix transcriptional regulator [Bacteroidales bacterium]
MDLFKYRLDIRRTRSEIASLLKSVVDDYAENEEPAENTESYELSDRETDVLVLVAKGLSSKEIADKLNISVHTVNSHRKNITHKTGIKSVAGLAVYAMIHNLM